MTEKYRKNKQNKTLLKCVLTGCLTLSQKYKSDLSGASVPLIATDVDFDNFIKVPSTFYVTMTKCTHNWRTMLFPQWSKN
jgi:hypothetical protein